MGAVRAFEAWEGGWAAVPVCCGDLGVHVGVDDVAEFAGETEEGGSLWYVGGHGVFGCWSISVVLRGWRGLGVIGESFEKTA